MKNTLDKFRPSIGAGHNHQGLKQSKKAVFFVVILSILILTLNACTAIPKQEITAFTGSYTEVDSAARKFYSDYERRLEKFNPPDPSTMGYFLVLTKDLGGAPEYLPKADKELIGSLKTRYAALDAMLAYNNALTGLVEGRRVEQIKSSLAPLSAALETALGPSGATAVSAIAIIGRAIENSKTREDLVKAMKQEITVQQSKVNLDDTTKEPEISDDKVETTGHPVDLLLELLEADANSIWIIYRANVSEQFLGLWTSINAEQNPDKKTQDIVRARQIVDDAKAYERTLVRYQDLVMRTREYFRVLREAALDQGVVLQTTEFVLLVNDLRNDAKTLIDNL